jgi:hypothetical protein
MFEVDRKGLAALVEGDGPERFAFELVQNAWDENVQVVKIEICSAGHGRTKLTAEDDSPDGWHRLSDAWTMFAPSYKRDHPDKRGRFDVGEKFVAAVAISTDIETTGGQVVFDEDGERKVYPRRKRERGTKVTVIMPWGKERREEALAGLWKLIPPPGVTTLINGKELPHRDPLEEGEFPLLTVLNDTDGAFRTTTRKTMVSVYETIEGETGTLYELGIPVVETGDSWNVSIGQKVPLTLDRSNVRPAFLKRVRGHVLNLMADRVTPDEAQERWVDEALASGVASKEATDAALTGRFGEKRVIQDPSDPEGTKKAMSQGYTVIPSRGLSPGAWTTVRNHGSALPAGRVTPSNSKVKFSADGKPPIPREEWTPIMVKFSEYAKLVGQEILGRGISTTFHRAGPIRPHGGWTAAYGEGGLAVNVSCAKALLRAVDQRAWDSILIHEFGHEFCSDHLSVEYHHALCNLGALLREKLGGYDLGT